MTNDTTKAGAKETKMNILKKHFKITFGDNPTDSQVKDHLSYCLNAMDEYAELYHSEQIRKEASQLSGAGERLFRKISDRAPKESGFYDTNKGGFYYHAVTNGCWKWDENSCAATPVIDYWLEPVTLPLPMPVEEKTDWKSKYEDALSMINSLVSAGNHSGAKGEVWEITIEEANEDFINI